MPLRQELNHFMKAARDNGASLEEIYDALEKELDFWATAQEDANPENEE